jgi:integrase
MKLDAKTVATLALAGKRDVIFFDGQLTGFGYRLRLGADGQVMRTWVVQYRRAGGTRRMTLKGVLSAEQARSMAAKLLARVELGEDPQGDKVERRDKDRVNLKSMIDEYVVQKQAQVRKRTMAEVRRYLTKDYFKALHGMPIDQITRKDVAARLVVITRERGTVSAVRARATLSAFFVWAMQSGLVEQNAVIGTLKPKDAKSRERVLSDAELTAIWRACGDDAYGRIIKLLVLLGARRDEIGGLCWCEFSDLEGARPSWTLPASRSKNKRALTLPLMPTALAIVRQVPRMVSRDQLFGERAAGFTSWARNKPALDKRSGVTGWTVHDIRRSVATRMADIGIAPHIIEAILNHHSGHKSGVAGIYNRSSYEREVRAALALWEDHVRVLVEGGERKVLAYAPANNS